MDKSSFFVVVPFYNEAAGITSTLESLAHQSDNDFTLVLVDNGSTDASVEVARRFADRHPELAVRFISEPQKGTGAASDTGFRYAIAQGARWIARTDADCLPRADWVGNLKRAFAEQRLELIAGKIKPRDDDIELTWRDRMVLPLVVLLAENFGKIHRRGPQFKYTYFMMAGNNMAITSGMYERAGGFPRVRIEEAHEDRALSEKVRTLTRRGRVCNDVVVYNSIRRARRYGYVNTLLWYWDHKYKPEVVDVRLDATVVATSSTGSTGAKGSLMCRKLGITPWRRPAKKSQRLARYHETRVYLASHSLAFGLAQIVRRLGASVRVPGLGTVINDPDLGSAILSDPRFTKSGPGSSGVIITQVMGEAALMNMDGADHRALRGRLANLFAPAYLESHIDPLLAGEMAALQEALAATRSGGSAVDLVDVMHRLSGRLMCHMLGVAPEPGSEDATYRRVVGLGSKMIRLMTLTTESLSPRQQAEARSYFEQLTELARPAFEDTDAPGDAVVHRLRNSGLTFEEARGILAVLFLAGTETLSTAVPRIVALLLDTGSFDRLRQDRGLLPSAIDEGLRLTAPLPVMLRSSSSPVRLNGHNFRQDGRIVLFAYNFMRHAGYSEEPESFDIRRVQHPRIKNLWFGAGPHFCLGYALAHREIAAVITALLDAPGTPHIEGRSYARGVLLPAYSSLRLRLDG